MVFDGEAWCLAITTSHLYIHRNGAYSGKKELNQDVDCCSIRTYAHRTDASSSPPSELSHIRYCTHPNPEPSSIDLNNRSVDGLLLETKSLAV